MLKFQRNITKCRFLFLEGLSASSIVVFLDISESNSEKIAESRSQFMAVGGGFSMYNSSSLNVFLGDHIRIAPFGVYDTRNECSTLLRALLSNSVAVGVVPTTKSAINFILETQKQSFALLLFYYSGSFIPVKYIVNMPQRFRKPHTNILRYLGSQKNIVLLKGSLALVCVEARKMSKNQIEAGRVAIGRILKKKRGGLKVFVSAYADRAITAKPSEVRMGKGKGDVVGMVYLAQRGLILYELKVPPAMYSRAVLALKYAQTKLPLRTAIVWRSRLACPIKTADDSSFIITDFI